MISYAQNYEDVVLWRALKDLKTGFYVDVGASHPEHDSITKHFYDNGWRGINIEPDAICFELLQKERPRDWNFDCMVGAADGEAPYFVTDTRGWGTGVEHIGQAFLDQGQARLETRAVTTLTSMLTQYAPREIHFLKIDVEGGEATVLGGLDLLRFRPWIIVIEAIEPITGRDSSGDWQKKILDADYDFVLFDGLNRFYLAREHAERSAALSSPASVLDKFLTAPFHRIQATTAKSEAELLRLEGLVSSLQRDAAISLQRFEAELQGARDQSARALMEADVRLSELHRRHHDSNFALEAAREDARIAHGEVGRLRQVIAAIRSTLSWKLGAPMRLVEEFVSIVSPSVLIKASENLLRRTRRFLPEETSVKGPEEVPATASGEVDEAGSYVAPLPKGVRTIYLYVDHTIVCSSNTGLQRVARGLATGLTRQGERVRYVKWVQETRSCQLIDMKERDYFARWNGPPVTAEELDIYSGTGTLDAPLHPRDENNWLIIPEVTHITGSGQPVTLDLIGWARRAGLKSGFVFYDAIPMRRTEYNDIAGKHREYMQHLRLADAVWPISKFSQDDLLAFWMKSERADSRTTPDTRYVMPSGEIEQRPRVTRAAQGQKTILSVGTIDPRKNQLSAILAFQDYLEQNRDCSWQMKLAGHLHPLVADEVRALCARNPAIQYLGPVSDEQLAKLYADCAFSVFPSVLEGFGLPILESLWYGKPCLCADFGSMAEIAAEGGCLTVDTTNRVAIGKGLARLIEDESLRARLSTEAISRPIPTWADYAQHISTEIERIIPSPDQLGVVYFWADATCTFPKNTGIQRVNRQLARSLLESGANCIAVKWSRERACFEPLSKQELEHLAQFNGPQVNKWAPWREPGGQPGWFVMSELPVDLPANMQRRMIDLSHEAGLRCVAVFYDAIPIKMNNQYPDFYNADVARNHRSYMEALGHYDLILPISNTSRRDFLDFQGATLARPAGIDRHVLTVELAGQFPERPRATAGRKDRSAAINLLCVGTVEPRKNHLLLAEAFMSARKSINGPATLHIVGRRTDPKLAASLQRLIAEAKGAIKWHEDADDIALGRLYEDCDFTVYPSLEEGFGLPILESLWCGKPNICANFGAMAEVATGSGCLMVDVRSEQALAGAIARLSNDRTLRESLVGQAMDRNFKSWEDYGAEFVTRLVRSGANLINAPVEIDISDLEKRVAEIGVKQRPLLSVCISTYNRGDWLATALQNWSEHYPQPVEGVELFVCDNCSTDHTPAVVQPYLARPDFSYHRNAANVGMLGNLRETSHRAQGDYIWILGDDDLMLPGSLEHVIDAIKENPQVALVYLNYAFTRIEDARTVKSFDQFFAEATPIVPPEPDLRAPIRVISTRNENFFTAIYALVFRRDHAMSAYSQDTSGRPFSTMLTAIPTTYHVLHHMMDEPGVWIGQPQCVVNMNVSWMKYAPIWILERVPELLELAEERGADPEGVDRWRINMINGIRHFFREIYENDPIGNANYFRPSRFVRRFIHLSEFRALIPELREVYEKAHAKGHPAARRRADVVFANVALDSDADF